MIEASGLIKDYGSLRALHGLDLRVGPGELMALFGGNGAGKTTTVNLFLGFIEPTAGSARVAGLEVAHDPVAARRNLAYVPELVHLYGRASPRENLLYFSALAGQHLTAREADARLVEMGLPATATTRPLGELSKGMRQKCGLAIALAKEAPAIFLDEPFSGLDPYAAQGLVDAIASLKESGRAILMCTHDLMRSLKLATHVGIMRRGRLVHRLDARTIQPADLESLYLETMGEAEEPVV